MESTLCSKVNKKLEWLNHVHVAMALMPHVHIMKVVNILTSAAEGRRDLKMK